MELRGTEADAPAKAWPVWAARHSTLAQERMTRGEEDTLANLIIFGTSFTAQPRFTQSDIGPLAEKFLTHVWTISFERSKPPEPTIGLSICAGCLNVRGIVSPALSTVRSSDNILSPTCCECSRSSKATRKRSRRLGNPGIPTLYSPPARRATARADCRLIQRSFPTTPSRRR